MQFVENSDAIFKIQENGPNYIHQLRDMSFISDTKLNLETKRRRIPFNANKILNYSLK